MAIQLRFRRSAAKAQSANIPGSCSALWVCRRSPRCSRPHRSGSKNCISTRRSKMPRGASAPPWRGCANPMAWSEAMSLSASPVHRCMAASSLWRNRAQFLISTRMRPSPGPVKSSRCCCSMESAIRTISARSRAPRPFSDCDTSCCPITRRKPCHRIQATASPRAIPEARFRLLTKSFALS